MISKVQTEFPYTYMDLTFKYVKRKKIRKTHLIYHVLLSADNSTETMVAISIKFAYHKPSITTYVVESLCLCLICFVSVAT
jgi:ubiquinone biosynthesis protein Coq4